MKFGGQVFKLIVPVLLLASAVAMFGSTTGVTPCATGTLSSYDGSYAPPSLGCYIGILDYSNFTYEALSNAPAESSILVTPSNQGFSFSQVGNIPFVAAGDLVQFAIFYKIVIDPAPVIGGANNKLDPPVGNVSVTEFFCNDSTRAAGTAGCSDPANPLYTLTVTTASPTASITFATPATVFQTVEVLFTLDGTNSPASFDSLDSATAVVVLPEPSSLFLAGMFLVAGGCRLRKKRED